MTESGWCATCCTQHSIRALCPGELPATASERHGWRVNADTPRGIEAYGVLLAPSRELWRARILTYPNMLWLVPGGCQSMKFVGSSTAEAEGKARDFIREYCRKRGYPMRAELDLVAPVLSRPAARPRARVLPAPRKIRFLPVRFGVVSPSESGGTGNLSETGMFIITEAPMESGTPLVLDLAAGEQRLSLAGQVIWMCKQHHAGRAPGMGVRLVAPPPHYLDYVRRLD